MSLSAQKALPAEAGRELKRVVIHVGEYFASRRPTIIQTLLGSCVSACLIDPAAGVAGMNHILLPGKARITDLDDEARFGVNAMELLINRMIKLGGQKDRFQAKVFGGAHIISGMDPKVSPGIRNWRFMIEFLRAEKIPIVGHSTGGINARRIFLRTDSGEVFLEKIRRFEAVGIISEERKYRHRVEKEMRGGGRVTLFR